MAHNFGVSPMSLEFSIEATPAQAAAGACVAGLFPPCTRVYLADLGGDDADTIVAAAIAVRHAGYEPVPHIAARRIASRNEIRERLARLTGEAGVGDMLIIGGGADQQSGPYGSTMDLLNSGLVENFGIHRLAIAGHPEGSPDISADAVELALREKAAYAAGTSTNMRIVTQFGFDPVKATGFLTRLGSAGIDLPVHLGVAGPAKISTLIKYAGICGVGPSLEFFKKRAGLLATLATRHSPEAVVEPIERWHTETPGSRLAGIHVFPFGGLSASSNWLYTRGSFTENLTEAASAVEGTIG